MAPTPRLGSLVDTSRIVREAPTVGPADLLWRRKALHMSQAELGRALGVARNTVARWERGELEMR